MIKSSAMIKCSLLSNYVTPLIDKGMNLTDFIAYDLVYEGKKAPAKLIKTHLAKVLEACTTLHTKVLLVADSTYFKSLTKERKAEPHLGYIKKCAIDGYEHIDIILTYNYQTLFYNPDNKTKIAMSIDTLFNHVGGTHINIGTGIIHNAQYPNTDEGIEHFLDSLHQYPVLVCDVETFSLDFWKAGIGTIAFAWDKHNGGAFTCDYSNNFHPPVDGWYGHQINNNLIKSLLLQFFLKYKGKLIYHGGTFDIKILIYELFMRNMLDNIGLIDGLDVMYKDMDCTKIITYLATNTTAGNKLGLKQVAFEYTGNYAQDDIEDIRRIEKSELLKYNLIDCLATWFAYEKNHPIMVADEQLQVHDEMFIPSMKVITHMELTGMPMDKEDVGLASIGLEKIKKTFNAILDLSPVVTAYKTKKQKMEMIEKNLLLKEKIKPLSDFPFEYNPSSPKQTQKLVYEHMGFPVEDYTDTKQPATGAKTLKKILNRLIMKYNITEEELK